IETVYFSYNKNSSNTKQVDTVYTKVYSGTFFDNAPETTSIDTNIDPFVWFEFSMRYNIKNDNYHQNSNNYPLGRVKIISSYNN
ncbi:MAG: hypothetical protein ACO3E1_01670, partial [Flavobacteriales bacterium]